MSQIGLLSTFWELKFKGIEFLKLLEKAPQTYLDKTDDAQSLTLLKRKGRKNNNQSN